MTAKQSSLDHSAISKYIQSPAASGRLPEPHTCKNKTPREKSWVHNVLPRKHNVGAIIAYTETMLSKQGALVECVDVGHLVLLGSLLEA
jgi:hypothetical protein